MKNKKLKNKVWNICTIKIDHYVAQEKTKDMTVNKTIGFLVKIKRDNRVIVMFRQDTIRGLWKAIKEHSMVYKF